MLRPRRAILALLVAGSLPLPLAASATAAPAQETPPAPAAPPAPADPVGEARKLHAEAKEFFKTAGDTDISREERKKARQEAYSRLKKAKEYLDAWLELHPGDAEALDPLYSDITITMLWIRKEGGIGEFGGAKPKSAESPPPAGSPPAEPGAPPANPAAPPAPAAPAPPITAGGALSDIEDYAKLHPGDVPGLHDRYSKFLTDFPNPGTMEFATAAKRLEELDQRLKDVYRKARDEDPDALANVDEGQVGRLVEQLSADLKSPEPTVRLRAARFLGGLGSGKASPVLFAALPLEQDAPTAQALKEALAKIAGRRTCEMLVKEKTSSPLAPEVVDILCMMVKKGGVNARIAGEFVADYVRGIDAGKQQEVAEVLSQAGADGALGLSRIVDLAPVDKKVGYIEHLGEMKDPRTAGNLARFLVVNPQGARRAQLQAALDAITKIGKPGVRYLIPVLDNKDNQVWTAKTLRDITGAKPKDDTRKTWEKWFRENRRAVEGR